MPKVFAGHFSSRHKRTATISKFRACFGCRCVTRAIHWHVAIKHAKNSSDLTTRGFHSMLIREVCIWFRRQSFPSKLKCSSKFFCKMKLGLVPGYVMFKNKNYEYMNMLHMWLNWSGNNLELPVFHNYTFLHKELAIWKNIDYCTIWLSNKLRERLRLAPKHQNRIFLSF